MTAHLRFARPLTLPLLAGLLVVTAACGGADGRPPAMLAEYNVLVVTPEALWASIEEPLGDSLLVRPFGQPAENPFRLTHRAPESVGSFDLRRHRMIVLLGTGAEVGGVMGDAVTPWAATPLSLATHRDLWGEGQAVTVAVLPDEAVDPAALAPLLGQIAGFLHAGLADWTVLRAFSTGTHPTADSLASAWGFAIDIPSIYRVQPRSDSLLLAATRPNDVDPLIRSVLVAWRPLDDAAAAQPPTPAEALDWRDAVVPRAYEWSQTTRRDPIEVTQIGGPESQTALQVRAFWSAVVDGGPRGGPAVLRVVDCPSEGRRYLLDSWLYAPNRSKHRTLLELEAVLDSFRCAPS